MQTSFDDKTLKSSDSYEHSDDYLKFINFQSLSPKENSQYLTYSEHDISTDNLKIHQKSKRILKREQAKKRTKEKGLLNKKQLDESFKESIDEKSKKDLDENDDNSSELSDKDRKKMQQKIRNRMSAQQSRDRKKMYIVSLEQQNAGLLSENLLLKDEILYLKQENEGLKEENYYLKNHNGNRLSEEINMIAMDPALDEETTNNSSYSSPFINGSPRNLFKYGMALLTIVAMVMFFNINSLDLKSVDSYIKKEIGTDLMVREKNYEDFIELNEYPALKYLKDYRREIMNKILVLEQKDNVNKRENNSLISYKEGRSLRRDEGKNQTQMVLFAENQEYPLSTLFCPNSYIYNSLDSIQKNKGKLTGIKTEWVHLMIPKNDMSQFYLRDDEIIITNVKQEDVRITTKNRESEEGWNSMIELWCKVSGIREISG